jgi:hypothetical protein
MLSADEMALFREMAAAYRKYGMRVSVTGAPLTIDRPGRFQGQVVGIDPKAFAVEASYPPQVETLLAANTSLTLASNLPQTLLSLVLTAGKWLVYYGGTAIIQTTAPGDYIASDLNVSSGTIYPAAAVTARVSVAGLPAAGTAGGFARIDTAGTTVNLRFLRSFVGTVTTTLVYGGSLVPGFQTYLGAFRIDF